MGHLADGEALAAPETLDCCGVGKGSVGVQLGSLGDPAQDPRVHDLIHGLSRRLGLRNAAE